MMHFFQPLDLTVNGEAKKFVKKEFITCYSNAVQQQLQNGKNMEDIKVNLNLTVINPQHAQWLVHMCNYLTGANGKKYYYQRLK